MPLFDLAGQGALVTGASRGMGLAMARHLGLAGARVVISSNEPDECARAASNLAAEGIDATPIECDVTSREDVDSLAARAVAALGRIDILASHAGGVAQMGPLADATEHDWDRTMTLNVRSHLWLTNRVIPHMAERGGGSVILTASLSSVRGNKALGLYGIAKAGTVQLARNLAVEWGPQNIRVNAISPGLIATEFARPLLDNADVLERRLTLTPLRRVGTPEEVAAVVVLLASPGGAFITGQNLIIDGGTAISDGS